MERAVTEVAPIRGLIIITISPLDVSSPRRARSRSTGAATSVVVVGVPLILDRTPEVVAPKKGVNTTIGITSYVPLFVTEMAGTITIRVEMSIIDILRTPPTHLRSPVTYGSTTDGF